MRASRTDADPKDACSCTEHDLFLTQVHIKMHSKLFYACIAGRRVMADKRKGISKAMIPESGGKHAQIKR